MREICSAEYAQAEHIDRQLVLSLKTSDRLQVLIAGIVIGVLICWGAG